MEINEIFAKLEIKDIEDMEYPESFCGVMELEEEIAEDVFFKLFKNMSFDTIRELTDEYFDEIISGIADDCMDFFSFISSYRRNFKGLINFCRQENNMNLLIAELFRFREWFLEEEKVICTNLDNNEDLRLSIFEALTRGRMERLSEGSYSFDYSGSMDLEYNEYEDYLDDEEPDEEIYEMEENDPSVTLIDKDFPVIYDLKKTENDLN